MTDLRNMVTEPFPEIDQVEPPSIVIKDTNFFAEVPIPLFSLTLDEEDESLEITIKSNESL